MSENILEIKNLSKKYDDFALKDISFNVPKGCIVGLVGENGAGKSTTIKAILNLIKTDGGEITILGKPNTDASVKEDIGVVFDDTNFPEEMTAKEVNQVMKHIYKKWSDKTYSDYIAKFDLPLKKPIKEYSRGMRMKLSIAVALSHRAKLLILDEATSGLDPVVREDILDAFLDFIQDEECGVLISSHILSDLEKASDYITFIHKGQVLLSKEKDLLMEEYGILKCSKEEYEALDSGIIKAVRTNHFGIEVLIEKKDYKGKAPLDHANVEDIMLFYVKNEKKEVRKW